MIVEKVCESKELLDLIHDRRRLRPEHLPVQHQDLPKQSQETSQPVSAALLVLLQHVLSLLLAFKPIPPKQHHKDGGGKLCGIEKLINQRLHFLNPNKESLAVLIRVDTTQDGKISD